MQAGQAGWSRQWAWKSFFARARGYLASAASMKPHTATGKGRWGVMILCVRVIGIGCSGFGSTRQRAQTTDRRQLLDRVLWRCRAAGSGESATWQGLQFRQVDLLPGLPIQEVVEGHVAELPRITEVAAARQHAEGRNSTVERTGRLVSRAHYKREKAQRVIA